MSVVILYRPELENPSRRAGVYLCGVFFAHGRNHLSDEQAKLVKTSPTYSHFLKSGVMTEIAVIDPNKENEDELVSLIGLTIGKALETIALEKDLKVLREWRDNESSSKQRDKVLTAIARQIKLVESGDI